MSLSKSKVFLFSCLAFVAGIYFGYWLDQKIMAVMAMIFIMSMSLGFRRPSVRLAGLLGLVMLAGAFRADTDGSSGTMAFDGKTDFAAVVCEEPDNRTDKTLLTLCGMTPEGQAELPYRVLATVQRFPEYSYGDAVSGSGKIQAPKDSEEPGEFSYRDYLARYGISAVVYYPDLEKGGENNGSTVKRSLLEFKRRFVSGIGAILPEPENAFLAGLLVGARRGIPEKVMKDFSDTGTTHIIAISGFNITIIAWCLDKLLSRFGRRLSFFLSLLCIVLFVILTGASASVVRAGVMGILGLIALNLGRVYAITNAFALTAVVMLGLNPKLLLFDVGFQLSFLSLIGLVYLSPVLERYFVRLPKAVAILLLATLSAQLFTLPILIRNFDRLSLVSPLANLLVLPLVPPAMLTGFLTGALAFLSPDLALPSAWASWIILAVIIKIVNILAGLPFAAVDISAGTWFIPVYYSGLFFLIAALKHPERLAGAFAKIKTWKKQPENY